MTEKPYWKQQEDWDAAERELSDLDRDALQRCVALTLAEPDKSRVEQVQSMLADRHWLQVAEFCAYHRQMNSLRLEPWQLPPSSGFGHDPKADQMLNKMVAAGLSQYDPDPMSALKAAKQAKEARKMLSWVPTLVAVAFVAALAGGLL